MNLIGLVLLHGEIAAIAQDDTQADALLRSFTYEGIVLNTFRYIIGVVIDGLAIVGGDGL